MINYLKMAFFFFSTLQLDAPSTLQNNFSERAFEHNGPWTNNKPNQHTHNKQPRHKTKTKNFAKQKTHKTHNFFKPTLNKINKFDN